MNRPNTNGTRAIQRIKVRANAHSEGVLTASKAFAGEDCCLIELVSSVVPLVGLLAVAVGAARCSHCIGGVCGCATVHHLPQLPASRDPPSSQAACAGLRIGQSGPLECLELLAR